MNALTFIFRNWFGIVLVVVMGLALALLLNELIKYIVQSLEDQRMQKKRFELDNILINLIPNTVLFIIDTEENYGPIKRCRVISNLYSQIPDKFKHLVSQAQLLRLIDKAFEEAKELGPTPPTG